LRLGQRAHINYTEAALTVIGFESENQYLNNIELDSADSDRSKNVSQCSDKDYTDIQKKGDGNHHILFPSIEDEFDLPSKCHHSKKKQDKNLFNLYINHEK
jgi:hypothetical protein